MDSSLVGVLFVLSLQCRLIASLQCPKLCDCLQQKEYPFGYSVKCESNRLSNNTHLGTCSDLFMLDSLQSIPSIQTLTITCYRVTDLKYLNNLKHLTKLSLSRTNITHFSLDYVSSCKHLNHLNLSSNVLEKFTGSSASLLLGNLEVIDVSNNNLMAITIVHQQIPNLRSFYLQNNNMQSTSKINQLSSLQKITISGNSFHENFNLSNLQNLSTFVARNVKAMYTLNADNSCNGCQYLAAHVNYIDWRANSLLQIPSCQGLLAGLQNLSILNLHGNKISLLSQSSFSGSCFNKLEVLDLSWNRLVAITPPSFNSLISLRFLNISHNFLQHFSSNILEKFSSDHFNLDLNFNQWSCDCFQFKLQLWLKNNPVYNKRFICQQPDINKDKYLESIPTESLNCQNVSIIPPTNMTAYEYQSGKITCLATGVPKPIVYWLSPHGETISLSSLGGNSNQQDIFSLSEFGQTLTVKKLQLPRTGVYRCVADNNVTSAEGHVALGVILSQTSTIILLTVACTAFIVAVVVNLINMFVYICEHIEKKRLYKKALQAQKDEVKVNPPIKHRSKSMDESMASLNANRHYSRYDYTCQQMFLDTVVKGAHSVKKTLYDARHSEFSANMWEYAANLRGRLHIEIPSGMQLPSISMPSISMPSISMPTISMPNMQDINTNIEKLSSSVMQRSHTLATSVGSVFTLKKWMGQPQANSSDNGSQTSEDEADTPGVSHVRVHVHNNQSPLHQTGHPSNYSPTGHTVYDGPHSSRGDHSGTGDDSLATTSGEDDQFNTSPIKTPLGRNVQFKENQYQQADGAEGPYIHTISSVVDTQFHSYETSV